MASPSSSPDIRELARLENMVEAVEKLEGHVEWLNFIGRYGSPANSRRHLTNAALLTPSLARMKRLAAVLGASNGG